MKHSVLLSAFVLVLSNSVQAQRVSTSNEQLWISHWGDHRVHDRWSLHSEAHVRRAEMGGTAQQLLFRPAVNYHLHEKVMVTGGYSYYANSRYGEYPIRYKNWEHHGFAQLQFSSLINKVRMQHRYRWERRWAANMVPGAQGDRAEMDGYNRSDRFRYRVWVTIPMGGDKSPWSINGYNEAFVSLGGSVTGDRFSQNRVSGLMGYQVNKEFNLMAGYLYQTINRPGLAAGADVLEMNSTLHIIAVYNLGLFKKAAPVVPVVG